MVSVSCRSVFKGIHITEHTVRVCTVTFSVADQCTVTFSVAVQMVSYWKCEREHTDLRLDFKYNQHAMARSAPERWRI
jgi:hypothetical protein